ncbi:MAG: guanylate kinase [Lachnospiraceae bacterium]|nr:guanylate kinase [Lachnospiraceae bacterium]
MGKIYYIMGKSSSGKDTLYKEVLKELPELRTLVLYTTRPIREGEREGVEYHFVTDKELTIFRNAGKIIEERTYDTVYGAWKYATIEDGQINLSSYDYLVIGTLESYEWMKQYYGEENLVPIYVEVEDGERLSRALNRERQQETPKYEEMCRRFLADQKDFSEAHLREAGITKRFYNGDKKQCLEEIIGEIRDE